MSPGVNKLNTFLMLKVPSAWICGVRIKKLTAHSCSAQVKHRWINQNPFNSMYFAVQAMAAELTTGALVMNEIRKNDKKISMLVQNNRSSFYKKAIGRITFESVDGDLIGEAISKTIETGEGQTFWMKSTGTNEEGVEVSSFEFEWTLKIKS